MLTPLEWLLAPLLDWDKAGKAGASQVRTVCKAKVQEVCLKCRSKPDERRCCNDRRKPFHFLLPNPAEKIKNELYKLVFSFWKSNPKDAYCSADITDDVLVVLDSEKFFCFEQSLHVSP